MEIFSSVKEGHNVGNNDGPWFKGGYVALYSILSLYTLSKVTDKHIVEGRTRTGEVKFLRNYLYYYRRSLCGDTIPWVDEENGRRRWEKMLTNISNQPNGTDDTCCEGLPHCSDLENCQTVA